MLILLPTHKHIGNKSFCIKGIHNVSSQKYAYLDIQFDKERELTIFYVYPVEYAVLIEDLAHYLPTHNVRFDGDLLLFVDKENQFCPCQQTTNLTQQ